MNIRDIKIALLKFKDNIKTLNKEVSEIPKLIQDSITPVEEKVNTNTDNIGDNTTSIGENLTAIGENTTAIGDNTTAIGENVTAIARNTELLDLESLNFIYRTLSSGVNNSFIGVNNGGILYYKEADGVIRQFQTVAHETFDIPNLYPNEWVEWYYAGPGVIRPRSSTGLTHVEIGECNSIGVQYVVSWCNDVTHITGTLLAKNATQLWNLFHELPELVHLDVTIIAPLATNISGVIYGLPKLRVATIRGLFDSSPTTVGLFGGSLTELLAFKPRIDTTNWNGVGQPLYNPGKLVQPDATAITAINNSAGGGLDWWNEVNL